MIIGIIDNKRGDNIKLLNFFKYDYCNLIDCETHSFKGYCKHDMYEFFMRKTGISTYSEYPKNKSISLILEFYFGLLNTMTNNKHWLAQSQEAFRKFDHKSFIIFEDVTEQYEIDWIKEIGGVLISINDRTNKFDYNVNLPDNCSEDVIIDTIKLQLKNLLTKIEKPYEK